MENKISNAINWLAGLVGGAVGTLIEVLYGPGPERRYLILVLIAAVVFDWVSGIAAAKKDGTYSSDYGKSGIGRTLIAILFPVVAYWLDRALNFPGTIFYVITVGVLYHTWESFTANSARAGWGKWIPGWVLDFVKSELEAKMARAKERQEKKGDVA